MDLFGDEYIDNNLVFCSSNGRPMESQVINRAFNKLIKRKRTASCCIPFSPSLQYHLQAETQWRRYEIRPGRLWSCSGKNGCRCLLSHHRRGSLHKRSAIGGSILLIKTPDPVEDTEPKTADTAVTESDESDAAKILELLKIPKLPHCSSSWQKLYKVPPSEERLSLCERFSSFEPLCTVTKHFFC